MFCFSTAEFTCSVSATSCTNSLVLHIVLGNPEFFEGAWQDVLCYRSLSHRAQTPFQEFRSCDFSQVPVALNHFCKSEWRSSYGGCVNYDKNAFWWSAESGIHGELKKLYGVPQTCSLQGAVYPKRQDRTPPNTHPPPAQVAVEHICVQLQSLFFERPCLPGSHLCVSGKAGLPQSTLLSQALWQDCVSVPKG